MSDMGIYRQSVDQRRWAGSLNRTTLLSLMAAKASNPR